MSQYKSLKVRFTGVVPLLLHNGQLANPLNPYSKAIKNITNKKKKTDADFEEIARLEWEGSLYLNEEKKIVIPGELVEATLVASAKKLRSGNEAKSGIIVDGNYEITVDGIPLPPYKELWDDEAYRFMAPVVVKRNRVMRMRPIIPAGWQIEPVIQYDPSVITNENQIFQFLEHGAIGDWRPKYGRFTATKAVEKPVEKKTKKPEEILA